jgi:hypothetical protein
MKRTTFLALVALALALPLSVGAAARPAAHAQPKQGAAAFAFGRKGGNIAPFRVVIQRDGKVTATGPVQPVASVSPDALAGLLTLARAEKFFGLPHVVACKGALPDFASFYVTVTTSSATRSVTVHGSCNRAFAQLYGVVSAVAGV